MAGGLDSSVEHSIGAALNWPKREVYLYVGFFLPCFVGLAGFTTKHAVKEWRHRRRTHILVLQGLILLMCVSRVLHLVLGAYHTRTMLGAVVDVPEEVVEIVYGIPPAAFLGAYCIQLAIFVQLGWAVSLKMDKLARDVVRMRQIAYFCCFLCFLVEVGADSLIFISDDYYVTHLLVLEWFCISLAVFISGVFFHVLLKFHTLAVAREHYISNAAQLYDDEYGPTSARSAAPVPTKSTTISLQSLRKALQLLPMRAQMACGTVLLGCLAVMLYSVGELVHLYHPLPADLFKAMEYTGRTFEVFAGLVLSYSVSAVLARADSNDTHEARMSQRELGRKSAESSYSGGKGPTDETEMEYVV